MQGLLHHDDKKERPSIEEKKIVDRKSSARGREGVKVSLHYYKILIVPSKFKHSPRFSTWHQR
jgi:hypothetical protein